MKAVKKKKKKGSIRLYLGINLLFIVTNIFRQTEQKLFYLLIEVILCYLEYTGINNVLNI